MEDITQLYNHLAKLPLDSKMKEIENILKKKKVDIFSKSISTNIPKKQCMFVLLYVNKRSRSPIWQEA